MMRILIVFVFIYVVFIGIALNIAKTYRIKNGVINILEHSMVSDVVNDTTVFGEDGDLRKYFSKIPYTITEEDIEDDCDARAGTNLHNHSTGACVVKVKMENSEEYYYKVYVYMVIHFKLFGIDNWKVPVSGETVTMPE